MGWLADNAMPSTFTDSTLSCASLASPLTINLSGFCNHRLDRQVERARAAQGSEAIARWSAIDHRLTDLAPIVPLVNRRSVDFVSARVGHVQHHLQGYTMLDQMWVR